MNINRNWNRCGTKRHIYIYIYKIKNTPWSESASELYRPSDRGLSAKLVQTFADRGCRVVSATDPYGRILYFLDRHIYNINIKLSLCLLN
jgi:hypothetical protein